MAIQEWMCGKTILISGGAGFFGKVLTEKLLRSCPGIDMIYLIIRSKWNKSAKERWLQVIKDELFGPLLKEKPEILNDKVVILEGDMSLIDLGLSEYVLEELRQNVNIIFHCAATVRFDDPLHKAFLANTRGTLEMCKLALKINNLESFVHVSTTYCNFHLNVKTVEEKVYEPCQDWRTVLKLIETEDLSTINILSYKILQKHPNTYTFSKSLSEKIVEEYSSQLPMVIVRPSVGLMANCPESPLSPHLTKEVIVPYIYCKVKTDWFEVIGIYKEPLVGWTDNMNGTVGVTSGCSKGVLRVMKSRPESSLDYVTVDVTINALIVCAWDRVQTREVKEVLVYNCAYGEYCGVTSHDLSTTGLALNNIIPMENYMWYPFAIVTPNDFVFYVLSFFLQILPGFLVDFILVLLRKKPMMTKVQKKIYRAMLALAPFTMKDIVFDNKKYKELWDRPPQSDQELFQLRPPSYLSVKNLMLIIHTGAKKYYFKENMNDQSRCKIIHKRLYYLDRIVRGILIYILISFIFKFIVNVYDCLLQMITFNSRIVENFVKNM